MNEAPAMSAKGEKTRTEIVETAKALFYQKGYHHTSFTDIVDAAGILRGNIYHYFKTKDDILAAVVEQRLSEFRKMLAQWDAAYAEPKARLGRFAEMLISRQEDLARYGCPVGTLNAELGKAQAADNPAKPLLDLFRDWLARQFESLGYGEDSDALALHLLGRAQGITVITHVYRDPGLLAGEVGRLQAWIEALQPVRATGRSARARTRS